MPFRNIFFVEQNVSDNRAIDVPLDALAAYSKGITTSLFM